MIDRARKLLPHAVALTMVAGAVVAGTAAPAVARPLSDSDLPADLRGMDAVPMPRAGLAPQAGLVQRVESGVASFYRSTRRFVRTATGERYDEMGMTAAHPFLPLGTKVRVTRQDTGESIVVRINDRAGNQSRVIDLSYGAAQRLGIHGVGQVTVAELSPNDAVSEPIEVAEAPDDSRPHIIQAMHRQHAGRTAWRHHTAHRHLASLRHHLTPHHADRYRL